MPNRASANLQKLFPDSAESYVPRLASAGLLQHVSRLQGELSAMARPLGTPSQSVQEIAADIEARQLQTLVKWRSDAAAQLQNPRLHDVEVLLLEFSSPTAITAREPRGSVAIAMDRRFHLFLSSMSAMAFVAASLELQGIPSPLARSTLLPVLADLVQVCYLSTPVPETAEERLLSLIQAIGQQELAVLDELSALAAKFVFLHELGHVHLEHFKRREGFSPPSGNDSRLAAFDEFEIEFEADRFASDHLLDPDSTITHALAAKVAPAVFMQILGLKEQMAPANVAMTRAILNIHPPYDQRAARLEPESAPAYLPQWAALNRMPATLAELNTDPAFVAAAAFFRQRAASKA